MAGHSPSSLPQRLLLKVPLWRIVCSYVSTSTDHSARTSGKEVTWASLHQVSWEKCLIEKCIHAASALQVTMISQPFAHHSLSMSLPSLGEVNHASEEHSRETEDPNSTSPMWQPYSVNPERLKSPRSSIPTSWHPKLLQTECTRLSICMCRCLWMYV